MVSTHYREELYCPCCKCFVTLLTLPRRNTGMKTFPRMPDELYICRAARCHEAERGVMTHQKEITRSQEKT